MTIPSAGWGLIGTVIGAALGFTLTMWKESRDRSLLHRGIRVHVWALLCDVLEAAEASENGNFNPDAWAKRLPRLLDVLHDPSTAVAVRIDVYPDLVLLASYIENVHQWLSRPDHAYASNSSYARQRKVAFVRSSRITLMSS